MINFDYIHKYTFSFMPLVPSYIKSLKSYKPGKTIAEAKSDYGIRYFTKLESNEKWCALYGIYTPDAGKTILG